MSTSQYFATLPADELASKLMSKEKDWDNFMSTSRMYEKMRRALFMVFGSNEQGEGTDKVTSKGDNGQLSFLRPNHLRAAAINVLTLTTSQRPALKPISSNTDSESQTQTLLAQSQLDYYMRDKRVERMLKEAAWIAITLGAAYLMGEWDSNMGTITAIDPNTGQRTKNGDLKFSTHMPPDVIFDYTIKTPDAPWHLIRTYENKFEMAALFPEAADQIVQLQRPLDPYRRRFDLFEFRRERDTDVIPVYKFVHETTAAVPDGRVLTVLSDKLFFLDGPKPYAHKNIFRIAPDTVFGSPFGYTSLFDAMSIQQGVEVLTSIPITNARNGGVNNIVARRGHNMDVTKIAEGYKLLEYDGPEAPMAMTFAQTPAEIFGFRQTLVSELGAILGGLNDVTRGIEKKDLSGAAMAMMDAQALRFSSGLQVSYKELCEDAGTFIIKTLQQFASQPRIARIAGKAKSYMVREFTGSDLSAIDSVTVETVDPMFSTTAGKMQIGDNMLQHGLVVSGTQYVNFIQTGQLEVLTEGPEAHRVRIKSENERLSQGIPCVVVPTDNHGEHLKEHAAVWSNPEVAENPNVYNTLWDHIEMHMTVWRSTDPGLLLALGTGMCPPGPLGVGPIPGMTPPPMPGTLNMSNPPAPGATSATPPPAPSPEGGKGAKMPNMPTNPATGQKWNPQTGGM